VSVLIEQGGDVLAWIRTIEPEDAEGRLAEAYAWQAAKLGRPTEFTRLGSLDPEIVHARLTMYRASENIPSALTAAQSSLISYLTSILNATPHCSSLSRPLLASDVVEALNHRDYGSLAPADEALARYVEKLTLNPGVIGREDIDALRAVGFGDIEILHANNQCAHLNYTNRVANGLGLLHDAIVEERTIDRVPQ
jgi:uncharacterized peroxidase-related enzyme